MSRRFLALCAVVVVSLAGASEAFAQAQTLAPPVVPQGKERLDFGATYNLLTRGMKDQEQFSVRWTTSEKRIGALFIEGDQHNREGNQDFRLMIGGVRNFGEKYNLWADFAFSPNADVIADRSFDVGGSIMTSPKTIIIAQFSRYHYPGGVALNLVIPGLLYIVNEKVMIMGQYIGTRVFGDAQNSGLFTVLLAPAPKVKLNLVVGFGNERYMAFTEGEVLRSSNMASFAATAQWQLKKNSGLTTTYQFQNRSAFYATHTFTASYFIDLK